MTLNLTMTRTLIKVLVIFTSLSNIAYLSRISMDSNIVSSVKKNVTFTMSLIICMCSSLKQITISMTFMHMLLLLNWFHYLIQRVLRVIHIH
jgi:hypothetical protein